MRFALLLLFLISCGDLPKEGSEKIEVKVELKYDNETGRMIAHHCREERTVYEDENGQQTLLINRSCRQTVNLNDTYKN